MAMLDPNTIIGILAMRHSHAPIVRLGPYRGDQASVDHMIPRSVVTGWNSGLLPESGG